MNIVFKYKDNRVDFISFLNPKKKILVFQDQIDYDLLFLGSERRKTEENENTVKKHMNIAFKNKVKSGDFFFVFDPKHKKASLLRPD